MSRTFTVGVRVRCWSEEKHFEVFAVSPHLQARCASRAWGMGNSGEEAESFNPGSQCHVTMNNIP